jgi:hypothetical protein
MQLPWQRTTRGLNSPRDLPYLAAWYDFKDVSSLLNGSDAIPANGDAIKTAKDKSGNTGRDITQGTAINRPLLTISPLGNFVTFDGSNDYLKAASFTMVQPTTVYFVGSQVTWTNSATFVGGNVLISPRVAQSGTTPRLRLTADGFVNFTTANADLALGVNGVVTSVFNTTNSSQRVNRLTATTGNPGTGDANGVTLGAAGDGSANANITASEILIYSVAHDRNTQNRVIQYLGRANKIAV